MLMAAVFRQVLLRRFFHPVREIIFKPIAAFSAYTKVTACFSIDPYTKINPLFNFLRAFTIPGNIFG